MFKRKKHKEIINDDDSNETTVVTAFTLISSAPSYDERVGKQLKKTDGIVECYRIFGEYDYIVKYFVEYPLNEKNLLNFVNKIRKIEGIIDTKTLSRSHY